MKKRVLSLFLFLVVTFSIVCPLAFADDSSTHVHNWESTAVLGFSDTVDGIPVSVSVKKCSECKFYKHTYTFFGFSFDFISPTAYTSIVEDFLFDVSLHIMNVLGKNSTATKAPSGIGRKDLPGYGDEGKANVTASGVEVLWVEPFGISGSLGSGFYSSAPANLIAGSSASGTQYFNTSLATAVYYFVAPVSGLYYLGSAGSPYDFGVFNYFSSDTWKSIKIGFSLSNAYSVSCSLNKGDKKYYCYTFSDASVGYGINQKPYKFNLNKIPIFIEPLGDTTINNYNKITINNNTWNGNIYVDNSTNLTYIYPEYTTINESGDTVTNISNNPIIYNNETKQYYTYDSVTNNYYYITYEPQTTPTPSPSPSPSPDPVEPILPDTQNYIIPKMNSNSYTDDHGTWVASGSSKYSDVFDYFRAFDRSTELWETNETPSNIQIEIPDPENYYIDGYIMRVSKFTNRYSKDWTLQGSDDGETWNDLDTQTGQDLSDQTEHKYSLTLHKSYKYYRLNMSNYASAFVSLSHFNLLGYDAKDVVIPSPSPSPSPDPGTDPTPTPTPGGDSDNGNGGGSTWNPFKWLKDLLEDIVEGILKAIWKLITSLFGFLLWLISLAGKVFPFIPSQALTAITAAVVIVTVIRIIKFITGR